jgi:segregation and condensation protein B
MQPQQRIMQEQKHPIQTEENGGEETVPETQDTDLPAGVSTEDGEADNGEADNGEADNGEADNGEADNGEADNGEADNGEADTGEADNGEADNGEADNGEADNGEADNGEADNGEAEDDPDFRGVLESLIFASDEPLTFRQIKDIVAPSEDEKETAEEDAPGKRRRRKKPFTITRVKRAIDTLNAEYEEQNRTFRIVEVAGGFAFQTTAEYGNWVGKLFAERSRRRLTQSALETLSIIAFRQPISKPAVEGIRGVNAEHVVKSLLERNLISIVGREDSPGRPLLYGTTKTFLKHFGLSSINDLPKPREIKDLLSSEEELASHSIEEMDPAKAAELTRVSSQELERLFQTAQLRDTSTEEEGEAEASRSGQDTEESGSGEGLETEDNARDTAAAPPVLHVHFDGDAVTESESDDDDDAITDTDEDGTEADTMITDETEEAADEDAESEDDASMENPFDGEEPDEYETM